MGIQFENATVTPELTFNRVFMTNLVIEQTAISADDSPPRYKMRLEYRLFAIDSKGKRHYKSTVSSIQINDYYSAAVVKAQAGDLDLVNAMTAIELAVKNILEDQTDLGGITVI